MKRDPATPAPVSFQRHGVLHLHRNLGHRDRVLIADIHTKTTARTLLGIDVVSELVRLTAKRDRAMRTDAGAGVASGAIGGIDPGDRRKHSGVAGCRHAAVRVQPHPGSVFERLPQETEEPSLVCVRLLRTPGKRVQSSPPCPWRDPGQGNNGQVPRTVDCIECVDRPVEPVCVRARAAVAAFRRDDNLREAPCRKFQKVPKAEGMKAGHNAFARLSYCPSAKQEGYQIAVLRGAQRRFKRCLDCRLGAGGTAQTTTVAGILIKRQRLVIKYPGALRTDIHAHRTARRRSIGMHAPFALNIGLHRIELRFHHPMSNNPVHLFAGNIFNHRLTIRVRHRADMAENLPPGRHLSLRARIASPFPEGRFPSIP